MWGLVVEEEMEGCERVKKGGQKKRSKEMGREIGGSRCQSLHNAFAQTSTPHHFFLAKSKVND